MDEHKRCPFCGGEPELVKIEEHPDKDIFNTYVVVQCMFCKATGKRFLEKQIWDDGYDCASKTYWNESLAWKWWDNRTDKPRKTYKVIVAGSRTFENYTLLENKLNALLRNVTPVIVCGEAKGADKLGRRYAEKYGRKIISCPADWDKYGKSAGYRRNEEMAKVADALVAFWDGDSKGTKHMIDTMKKLGKPVKVIQY